MTDIHRVHVHPSACVFQRASLRNHAASPLLAGPVTLIRNGAYAGVGEIAYVGAGESFDLSFGSEDRFVVKYNRHQVNKERRIAAARTHFVQEVEISTSDIEAPELQVLMRIPVSEISQVKVRISQDFSTEPLPQPDHQGLLRFAVRVKPGSPEKIALGFWFDTSGDVAIPDPW